MDNADGLKGALNFAWQKRPLAYNQQGQNLGSYYIFLIKHLE